MRISKQARRGAKEVFRASFTNKVMDPAKVRQNVQALLARKPRGYVAILDHLTRLIKLEEDRRAASIESSIPLSSEQQSNLTGILTRLYGPGLNVGFAQNPALIGGLRVKVGSDVYDSSIQSRLQKVAEAF